MRWLHGTTLASALAALLALGAGCGDDAEVAETTADERPSARPKEEAPSEEVTPAPIEEPTDDYSYVSIGKRDPFRSFIQKEVVVTQDGGPVGPLQLHEIDEYSLRGIVWNISEPKALIEDPEGVGHVVELQTLIGKNWGRITQIKPTELIITEEYRDPIENELIINEVTMRLPDPSQSDESKR